MVYFITGGARSGKSSYGQELALKLSDNPVYLATSRIWDDDHKARIARHQKERGSQWTNIEEEKYLSKHNFTGRTVLVDCVTLWVNNFYFDLENEVEKTLAEAKAEISKLLEQDATFIIITNELGMGMHPETEVGRKFTDIQGWINQFIASKSDEVYLMVAGIPMKVK